MRKKNVNTKYLKMTFTKYAQYMKKMVILFLELKNEI